jgi:hypothetical protein
MVEAEKTHHRLILPESVDNQLTQQRQLHYNEHRPHQAMRQAAALHLLPPPITDPDRIARLDIRRNDRLGGIIHEYQHAA